MPVQTRLAKTGMHMPLTGPIIESKTLKERIRVKSWHWEWLEDLRQDLSVTMV